MINHILHAYDFAQILTQMIVIIQLMLIYSHFQWYFSFYRWANIIFNVIKISHHFVIEINFRLLNIFYQHLFFCLFTLSNNEICVFERKSSHKTTFNSHSLHIIMWNNIVHCENEINICQNIFASSFISFVQCFISLTLFNISSDILHSDTILLLSKLNVNKRKIFHFILIKLFLAFCAMWKLNTIFSYFD